MDDHPTAERPSGTVLRADSLGSNHRGALRRSFFLAFVVAAALLAPGAASAGTYVQAVTADSPSGWWRLDEAPGAVTAADSSGHGVNLYYDQSSGLGAQGALATDSDTAWTGSPGIAVGGSTPKSAIKSAEVWFRQIAPVSSSPTTYISNLIGLSNDGDGLIWTVELMGDGSIQLVIQDYASRTKRTVVGPTAGLADGQWHYVAAIVDGAGSQVYVDGQPGPAGGTLGTFNLTCGGAYDGQTPCYVPTSVDIGGGMTATFDEAAVYDHDLTAAQISAHYAAGTDVDTSNEPSLTDEEGARIVQLATADPRVQAIIGGRAYTVGPVATWTKFGGSALIGGVLELDFALPTTISANWPEIQYNAAENTDPVYQTLVESATASGVTSLDVKVDLNCSTVVSVLPAADSDSEIDDGTASIVSGPTQPAPCGDPPSNKTWERNLREVTIGTSYFFNYDFNDSALAQPDSPIDLVFWGFAPPPRQATALYQFPGSAAYDFVGYGSRSGVFSDGGQKDKVTCHRDYHFRLFGDPEAMVVANAYLGYFWVGAAHSDFGDSIGCGEKWFGAFEHAERHIASKAASVYGTNAVRIDAVQMYNPEGIHTRRHGYWDGNHWRSNDGLATRVHVCSDQYFLATNCSAAGAAG